MHRFHKRALPNAPATQPASDDFNSSTRDSFASDTLPSPERTPLQRTAKPKSSANIVIPSSVKKSSFTPYGHPEDEILHMRPVQLSAPRMVRPDRSLSRKTSLSHAEILEFNVWLDECLEDFGLDSAVYGRCIHSILRQQPGGRDDDANEQCSDDWYPRTSVVGSKLVTCAANANVFDSSAQECFDARKETQWRESARTALLQCLQTDDTNMRVLNLFVGEIVNKYQRIRAAANDDIQNDSVDSGVCPSPEESFQNYDEAFPPLGDACEEVFAILTADPSVGRALPDSPPADDFEEEDNLVALPVQYRSCGLPDLRHYGKRQRAGAESPVLLSSLNGPVCNSGTTLWTKVLCASRASESSESSATSVASVIGIAPNKRQKQEDNNGNLSARATLSTRQPRLTRKLPHARPLNSCPNFYRASLAAYPPLFCCPKFGRRCLRPAHFCSGNTAADFDCCKSTRPIFALNTSPCFVIPKCHKVSPFPSTFSLPFAAISSPVKSWYQCSPDCNSNSIINNNSKQSYGSPASLASQAGVMQHAVDVPAWQCCEWFCPLHKEAEFNFWNTRVGETSKHCDLMANGDMMELSPRKGGQFSVSPETLATSVGSSGNSNNAFVMFDAPTFILDIISEDSCSSPEGLQQQGQSTASESQQAELSTFTANDSTASNLPFAFDASAAYLEHFGFQVKQVVASSPVPEFSFSMLQQNDRFTPYENIVDDDAIEFCLPKLSTSFPGMYQQQQRSPDFECSFTSSNGAVTRTAEGSQMGSKKDSFPAFYQPQLQQALSQKQMLADSLDVNAVAKNARGIPVRPRNVAHHVTIPVSPLTHFIPIRSESMEDAYYPKPGFDDGEHCDSGVREGYHVLLANRSNSAVNEGGQMAKLRVKFKAANQDEACQAEPGDALPEVSNAASANSSCQSFNVPAACCGVDSTKKQSSVSEVSDLFIFPLEADTPPDTSTAEHPTWAQHGITSRHLEWREGGPFPYRLELISVVDQPCGASPCCVSGNLSKTIVAERDGTKVCCCATSNEEEESLATLKQLLIPESQVRVWRRQDEQDDDQLLRYVSNISLTSPLVAASSTGRA